MIKKIRTVIVAYQIIFSLTSLMASDITSSPYTLRAEPIPLENPNDRCVRNALLQATIPMTIDIINIHEQRTGMVITDSALIQMISTNDRTRAELASLALMRVALALNTWDKQVTCGSNAFNSGVQSGGYGEADKQMSLIAQDIVNGFHTTITAARITYHQLPVDRHLLPAFALDDYITARMEEIPPDFLVIDTSSSETADFDTYAPISAYKPPLHAETQLPASFSVTMPNGSVAWYTVLSFCNFERSGIAPNPTLFSRVVSVLEWLSTSNGLIPPPFYVLPQRHATAGVRYGDDWFIADDTRIWQADAEGKGPLEIGQALLNQYPGMRALVFYKKISDNSNIHLHNNQQQVNITLIKTPYSPKPTPMQHPMLIWLLSLLPLVMAAIIAFSCMIFWQYTARWKNPIRTLTRVIMLTASSNLLFSLCGKSVYLMLQARKAYNTAAHTLTLHASDEHMSGLSSTPTTARAQ